MIDETEPLKEEMPAEVAAAVREHVGERDTLKIVLAGDLLPDGMFGRLWFVMNDARLAVFTDTHDGVTPEPLTLHELTDGDALAMTAGVSTAVMELTHGGVKQRLLRVSNARQRDFAEAVRLINTWLKDKTWQPELLDHWRNICARCRRPLPENTTLCPHCLDKKLMIRKVLTFLRAS